MQVVTRRITTLGNLVILGGFWSPKRLGDQFFQGLQRDVFQKAVYAMTGLTLGDIYVFQSEL
jgi:hypothetical protein